MRSFDAEPNPEPVAHGGLRRLGRNVLAIAGVSAALLSMSAFEVSASAAADVASTPTPLVNSPVDGNPQATAPLAPMTPRAVPFARGITTYNWNGDGGPQMFGDMQELGLTGVRLSLVRSGSAADLATVQSEVPVAVAHNVDDISVNLEDVSAVSRVGFAQWAAQTADQLPAGVNRVIIENEVNNPNPADFYGFSMQTYVNELAQTYQAIKAVRPNLEVCGFGLDSIPDDDPLGYLQQAALYAYAKYGGLQNIEDCLSAHLYLSPQKDEDLVQSYESVTTQPIYIDEFGRNVASGVSLVQQATQTAQFMVWAGDQPQVWGVNNYLLRNRPGTLQTGLETPTGGLLPVARSLQALPVDH